MRRRRPDLLTENRASHYQCCQQQDAEVINADVILASGIGLCPAAEEIAHGNCCARVASGGFNRPDTLAITIDAQALEFALFNLVSEETAEGSKTTSAEVGVAAGANCCEGMNLFATDLDEEAEFGVEVINCLPADFVVDEGIDNFNGLFTHQDPWSEKNQVAGVGGSDAKDCYCWMETCVEVCDQGAQAKKPNQAGEEVGRAWSEGHIFHSDSFTHQATGNLKELRWNRF